MECRFTATAATRVVSSVQVQMNNDCSYPNHLLHVLLVLSWRTPMSREFWTVVVAIMLLMSSMCALICQPFEREVQLKLTEAAKSVG